MSNEIVKEASSNQMAVLEQVVVNGDISKLTPQQRVDYYTMRCEAAGLDPRTQPFSYITLQGKLTLYATKTATEQLCEKRGLSVEIVNEGFVNDLYRVQARVAGKDGRRSDNIGVVTVTNLKGDALANAMMKSVTKAYRRAVLSHCGLGMLDESEIETIPGAQFPAPAQSTLPHALEAPAASAIGVDVKPLHIAMRATGAPYANGAKARWLAAINTYLAETGDGAPIERLNQLTQAEITDVAQAIAEGLVILDAQPEAAADAPAEPIEAEAVEGETAEVAA